MPAAVKPRDALLVAVQAALQSGRDAIQGGATGLVSVLPMALVAKGGAYYVACTLLEQAWWELGKPVETLPAFDRAIGWLNSDGILAYRFIDAVADRLPARANADDPLRSPAEQLREALNELVGILTERPANADSRGMALDVIAKMRGVVDRLGRDE